MDQLFPKEIIEFSSESHYHKYRVRGIPIYLMVILLLVLLFASLPFIKIDISYSTRGILRTENNACKLSAPREGELIFNSIELHKTVNIGDTLMVINHSSISEELADNLRASDMIHSYIVDLQKLLSTAHPISLRYQQVWLEYQSRVSQAQSELIYIQEEYETSKSLYNQGFIPRMEYESVKKQFLTTQAAVKIVQQEFHSRWQSDLSTYKLELLRLKTKHSYLENSLQYFIITAPISGSIADYQEIIPGSFISTNTQIARIVPNQDLIATCMVSSDKISRIRHGQKVRLSIDAYPGSTYGRADAEVTGIPQDASNISQIPTYPITCSLLKQELNKSGFEAMQLKSGMTFTALFILNRKSLLQLLIEKGEKLLLPENYQNVSYEKS